MRPSCLLSIVAVVLATVVSACSSGATPVAGTSEAGRVNEAMTAVATERVEVERIVSQLVEAAGLIEPMASNLRTPEGVDAALDGVPATVAVFDSMTPADGAAAVDALDLAIGRAAGVVDVAIEAESEGSWERDFLRAQRAVLDALAGWSASNASVIAELDSRWETWDDVVREAAVLDENRWRYRTPEEAAGTWEVEMGDQLPAVREASAVLPSAVEVLATAADTVKTADDRAAEVFRNRPSA